MVDPSISRNLDTQSRRLAEVEAKLDALLAGEDVDYEAPFSNLSPSYEQMTRENEALRQARSWTEIDLESAMTEGSLAAWHRYQAHQRIRWTVSDAATVGLSGIVGVLAAVFDDQIDQAVMGGLSWLHETSVVQRWEKSAKNMPIDYTGPNFGGPGHRVRSAGHDFGRPFEALSQIRSGEFTGTRWFEGVRETVTIGGYEPVEQLGVAIALWLKHLAADVVTTMSLPLPGWTKLYELPDREIRKFAHQAYDGIPTQGVPGLNVRTGVITPMLAVLAVEIIIRTAIHWSAYQARREWSLTVAEKAKMHEMLLVGQGVTAAASISRAVLPILFTGGFAAPELRHINVPALIRVGTAGWQVFSDRRARAGTEPPAWEELLLDQYTHVSQSQITQFEQLCEGLPADK